MRYSCGNCYHYAKSRVDEEPCVSCKQRSHFLPEPEYSRQAILALEKELKTKYDYDDERINRIIDNFNVKMELNMNNYVVIVSLGDFVKYTMGEIYYLAPNHNPRGISEIQEAIISRFMDGCKQIGEDFFYHEIALKDLYKFISDILMPIEKFRELNLSQREFDNGIKVNDEERDKFAFTDRYTSISEYDNFIDLDACIQNIFSRFELEQFRIHRDGEIEIAELVRFRNAYRQDKEA